MGATLMAVKSWGFTGSIDATEYKKEYCEISAMWNILSALDIIERRPLYDDAPTLAELVQNAIDLNHKIYSVYDTDPKEVKVYHNLMNLMSAVSAAGLKGKWDLHSIALNTGWDRIVDRPLELERLSDFNIHLSDTRQYLSNTLPNHKKKNTFFYLDAHWDADDYPLLEELELLSSVSELTPIIAIDDFKTPGKRYGYDKYHDKICGPEFIMNSVKDLTDTIYCCPKSNIHNRGQGIIFYNRNKKDIQKFLDRYPLIEVPIK